MTTPINTYIEQWLGYPIAVLAHLDQENSSRNDIEPNIGRQVGSLLDWVGTLIQAKQILEFGTCIGFSTIYLAQLAKTYNGKVTAVEINEQRINETRKNLETAGLTNQVQLIQGNALVKIKELQGPYDLILQDSNKSFYQPMLEDCIRLLRPGGVLISDDTLFPTMDVPAAYQTSIHAYNQAVFNHPGLKSTMIPIGDGVTLSIKLP